MQEEDEERQRRGSRSLRVEEGDHVLGHQEDAAGEEEERAREELEQQGQRLGMHNELDCDVKSENALEDVLRFA